MPNNLRELRTAKNLTMRDLAERMSTWGDPVHFTTIAKIERSQRKLTPEWVERLAKGLEITPAEITGDAGANIGSSVRQIPVIGLVAAGNWREAIEETSDYMHAPTDEPNAFALRVDGDSMDQFAMSGDFVMVDPDQFELLDGQFYVVRNDEAETTFKRYRSNPARLEPASNNPQHQPMILGQAPFSVVGRVIGIYRPF